MKKQSPRGFSGVLATSLAMVSLVGLGAVGLGGCKLNRAQVRNALPAEPKGLGAPKTLKGSFSMLFEPSADQRFPIHMSFVLDFSKGGSAGVLTTCLDSDGGLSESDAKKGIAPDKAVPFGAAAGLEEAAIGMENSPLPCAESLPLADRVNGTRGGTLPLDVPVQAGLTSDAPETTPISPEGASPESTSVQVQGPGQAQKLPPNERGEFSFTSKPDASGKSIRFTLRANDAGWHVESLDYFGVPAFVGPTETVAMQEPL